MTVSKPKAVAPYADLSGDPRDWEGWNKAKGFLPPVETPNINALARDIMRAGNPAEWPIDRLRLEVVRREAIMLRARADRWLPNRPSRSDDIIMCCGARLIPISGLLTYQPNAD